MRSLLTSLLIVFNCATGQHAHTSSGLLQVPGVSGHARVRVRAVQLEHEREGGQGYARHEKNVGRRPDVQPDEPQRDLLVGDQRARRAARCADVARDVVRLYIENLGPE